VNVNEVSGEKTGEVFNAGALREIHHNRVYAQVLAKVYLLSEDGLRSEANMLKFGVTVNET
jgi:hypothetical protein